MHLMWNSVCLSAASLLVFTVLSLLLALLDVTKALQWLLAAAGAGMGYLV
jgi:hypothetical protein